MTKKDPLFDYLNLPIDCISTRSALQILSLKDEYNFCYLYFLIIRLRNFTAKFWFGVTSLLTPTREDFFSNHLNKPVKQVYVYALSSTTLLEAVLLGKPLKSP